MQHTSIFKVGDIVRINKTICNKGESDKDYTITNITDCYNRGSYTPCLNCPGKVSLGTSFLLSNTCFGYNDYALYMAKVFDWKSRIQTDSTKRSEDDSEVKPKAL
jgi:hypothetical protein